MRSLEERLHEFILQSNLGAEDADDLDELFKKADGTQHSRPDYFLRGRSVIVEKKTLTKDPAESFNVWLNDLTKSDPWLSENWIFPTSAEQIISAHPEKEEFRSLLVNRLYRGFRNEVMRKASDQLLTTQRLLNLDNAVKGLFILNEKVEPFETSILVKEIEINLTRKKTDGELECLGIDFVMLISETVKDTKDGRYPCSLIISDHARNKEVIPFHMRDFIIRWSAFNGRPILSF